MFIKKLLMELLPGLRRKATQGGEAVVETGATRANEEQIKKALSEGLSNPTHKDPVIGDSVTIGECTKGKYDNWGHFIPEGYVGRTDALGYHHIHHESEYGTDGMLRVNERISAHFEGTRDFYYDKLGNRYAQSYWDSLPEHVREGIKKGLYNW